MFLIFASYVAVAATAMSAALVAGRRKMDWFGVVVLSSVTALGGGTIRDVVLGHYPLAWVADPMLLIICCAAAFLTILLARFMPTLRIAFLLLDAFGLVVFTVGGCEVAAAMGQPALIIVVAGMVSGIVGGVLRDVLVNEVPLVFSTELYATVAIVAGALYTMGVGLGWPQDFVALGTIVIGFTLRVLAIVFRLEMPKFIYDKDLR